MTYWVLETLSINRLEHAIKYLRLKWFLKVRANNSSNAPNYYITIGLQRYWGDCQKGNLEIED